jgi:hypothetical protein
MARKIWRATRTVNSGLSTLRQVYNRFNVFFWYICDDLD